MISELGQGRYKMNLECFVRTINKKVVKTNTKKKTLKRELGSMLKGHRSSLKELPGVIGGII